MPRPLPTFHGFVGNARVVRHLQQQCRGAIEKGEPVRAIGLFGPSGFGKTHLFAALASEFAPGRLTLDGHETASSLARKFRAAAPGDWVFIDESHALSPDTQELLFGVIDDRRLVGASVESNQRAATDRSEPPDKGVRDAAGTGTIVQPVTLVLATDQPGRLRPALLKRLELTVNLGPYRRDELRHMAAVLSQNLDVQVSAQGRTLLVDVCNGIPRRLKHYLEGLGRHFPALGRITARHVRQFLRDRGVDRLGLERLDRRYLQTLGKAGKASAESMSLRLGSDVDYLRAEVEGPLERRGFITISTGGREFSAAGRKWFEAWREQRRKRTGKSASHAGVPRPAPGAIGQIR